MVCDIDGIDPLNCRASCCSSHSCHNQGSMFCRNKKNALICWYPWAIHLNRCNRRPVLRSGCVATMKLFFLSLFFCRCRLLSWVAVAVGMKWSSWSSASCSWYTTNVNRCDWLYDGWLCCNGGGESDRPIESKMDASFTEEGHGGYFGLRGVRLTMKLVRCGFI